MSVLGSYLYVGTWNLDQGCEVWRSPNGTTWKKVGSDGFGDEDNEWIYSSAVFGSYLYLATRNSKTGCEVWRTDGTGTQLTWTQVNSDGYGDPDNWYAHSMVVFDSYLYVGTMNQYGDGCEIWRTGAVGGPPLAEKAR